MRTIRYANVIQAVVIVACMIVTFCFFTTSSQEYQIRITIPAGYVGEFSYSDEEICAKRGTVTIYAGEGLGDTEITLLPVDGKEKNIYKPTYITHGMPVLFEVKKGVWYKIGVNVQNRADADKNVYVSVKDVDIRIADVVETERKSDGESEETAD